MQEAILPEALSITLTPTHECIPRLTEFLEGAGSLPVPKRAQLLHTLQSLNNMQVKQFTVLLKDKKYTLKFRVNEKRNFEGTGDTFDEALVSALDNVLKYFCA